VVFVCCYSQASPIAYTLAKSFRRAGVRTVIGGPHVKAFPVDCLRFYDLVVRECDETLIADILSGQFDPGSAISSARPFSDVTNWRIKPLHRTRTSGTRSRLAGFREILLKLRTDSAFRAFHEGRTTQLPQFYHDAYERSLHRYASLVSRRDRIPHLDQTAAPPVTLAGPAAIA
jgi:hypothetical protein